LHTKGDSSMTVPPESIHLRFDMSPAPSSAVLSITRGCACRFQVNRISEAINLDDANIGWSFAIGRIFAVYPPGGAFIERAE
jgi:hypothetical protein